MSKFMNFGDKKSLDFLDCIKENVTPIMREDKETVFTLGITGVDDKHYRITLMPEKIYSNIEQFDNLKKRFDEKLKKFPQSTKSIDYLLVHVDNSKEIIESHRILHFMNILHN